MGKGTIAVVAILLTVGTLALRFYQDPAPTDAGRNQIVEPSGAAPSESKALPSSGDESTNDRSPVDTEPYEQKFGFVLKTKPSWRPRDDSADVESLTSASTAELVQLALDGNGFIARQLSLMQRPCRRAPKTEAELEVEIEALKQSRVLDESPTDGALLANNDDIDRTVATMRGAFAKCVELAEALGENDIDLLQLAAEHENAIAMIEYASQIVSQYPDLARDLYVRSWEQGEAHALYRLSEDDLRRFEAGTDPTGDVSAAAHMLAFAALHEARSIRRGQSMPSTFIQQIDAQVENLLGSLQPYQRPEAEARARDLISENDNCCFE